MLSRMSSFSNNRDLCVLTVLALRLRRLAMSSFRSPCTSINATSSSRGDSSSNGEPSPPIPDSARFCAMRWRDNACRAHFADRAQQLRGIAALADVSGRAGFEQPLRHGPSSSTETMITRVP